MVKLSKTALWLTGISGILLMVAVSCVLLFPSQGLLEKINRKITEEFRLKTGYELQYKSLDLSLFPSPHVVFRKIHISSPGLFDTEMPSLTVVPRLLAFIRGNAEIASIRCEAPQTNLQLVSMPQSETQSETIASHLQAQEDVVAFLAGLASKLPDLQIFIADGRLNLMEKDKPRFQFHDIHGSIHLSPERPKVEVQCKSDLFEAISLNAWLDTKTLKSQGKFSLTRLTPQKLTHYFFPYANCQVKGGQADFEATFESSGPQMIQSHFRGKIPYLDLLQNGEDIFLKGGTFEGTVQRNGDQLDVAFSRLQFDTPRGSLTGKYFRDARIPLARLDLDGKDIDAAALRKVALALGGNNEAISKVFTIIRAGDVPLITCVAQGKTLSDLKKLDHMVINGRMIDGTILVPKIDLEVQKANGEVLISEEILEGKNLEGVAGKSFGREGKLIIGLMKGDNTPFHLDILLDADLVQLPPILERVVKSDAFLREMRLMKEIQGRAVGHLVLGESLDAVKTDLDIQSFNLSSNYQRLPSPLHIQGGTFGYHGNEVTVQSASGTLGKSALSQVSVAVRWGNETRLEVTSSSRSRIDLDAIYPWLLTHPVVKRFLKHFESMKGVLLVDSLNMKGPVLRPGDWVFQAEGGVENFSMNSSFLPGLLTVKKGRFEADAEKLSFFDCSARILDSSFVVTGSLDGYTKGLRAADLSVSGELGTEGNRYISDLIHLPDTFRLRSPLQFSQARFAWNLNGDTSFSAQMSPKDGPKMGIEVLHNRLKLNIKKLVVKDDASDASASLLLSEGEFDISFAGGLKKSSVDRLLLRNPFFTGAVEGSFETQFSLDAPLNSKAGGQLHIEGFQYKDGLKKPAVIERADLSAVGNQIHVKSSQVSWGGSLLNFQGNVDFSAQGLLLNMDVSADSLDWDQIRYMKEESLPTARPILTKSLSEPPSPRRGDESFQADTKKKPNLTLQGLLNVKAGKFTYGKLTWQDVATRVFLQGDEARVEFTKGSLCGIPTQGTIGVTSGSYHLEAKPNAKDVDIVPTLACLWNRSNLMTGRFDLTGDLKATGNHHDLTQSLEGNLKLTVRDGRIYRMGLLARIFSVINITEIYRGKFPDLMEEGFAYDTIEAEGSLAKGKMTLKKGIIDGPYLKMVWRGTVDLQNENLDMTVLVSPLRTVDRIISSIPLLGNVLGGSLIAIPVRVTGNIKDPNVVPLAPSAIGAELFGYVERTFKLPVTLLQPFL
ncbi:DUF3971 domain-containing protein [Desulforhabdus amnigena]|jgi:hypothetical protein|uniref:YhdP central domain-containing protein n=1 Tax=Desulforhabdus amnigena TaxID=40218 RepID=A0A9W6CYR1_9BACT|nr:DUF3971 domain-containing protein [Desulforhabdus amnigena]NLJ29709.1 hypothetical protein [Deltaproteobacteria bacterium]GLI32692.1 hypothetical protein DAMNIGENAA_01250 [Desulforhabdus amnigena]